jgi:hypothetical protein
VSLWLTVTFGIHVPLDSMASMVSGIAAYGNVAALASPREFSVEVFRSSKEAKLKAELARLEQYGFLKWQETSN